LANQVCRGFRSSQRQGGIDLDNFALGHLRDCLERVIFAFLLKHALEDLVDADGRDDKFVLVLNGWPKEIGVWVVGKIF